jgi:hypothetical protein
VSSGRRSRQRWQVDHTATRGWQRERGDRGAAEVIRGTIVLGYRQMSR